MATWRYHKDRIGNHKLHPETLMLGYGYEPALSEGAVKAPVFLTSTFVFRNAEEGRDFFDYVSGRRTPPAGDEGGLVYSRFNHPNSEIVEDRLAIFEEAETAVIFSSGMSAIATTLLAYDPSRRRDPAQPAALWRDRKPAGADAAAARRDARKALPTASMERRSAAPPRPRAPKDACPIILVESPSNPLNTLVDLALVRTVAEEIAPRQNGVRPLIVCDNTLLGPIFQKPLRHGTDIVIYSLTKYVGGHSDLVAGAALGSQAALRPIRQLRGAIGTQLDPHSCWMLARSLETLTLRMTQACRNADSVARFLAEHPNVDRVYYPALLPEDDPAHAVFLRQCTGAGTTFSFDVKGGRAEAFAVLNKLQIVKLAVSLGGTESLACHPASTVHSGVPVATTRAAGNFGRDDPHFDRRRARRRHHRRPDAVARGDRVTRVVEGPRGASDAAHVSAAARFSAAGWPSPAPRRFRSRATDRAGDE